MSTVLLRRAIDRQNRAWSAMQEIRERAEAENRDMTAEERRQWDQLEAELNEASGDIERFERELRFGAHDAQRHSGGAPQGEQADGDDPERRHEAAFNAYLRRGFAALSPEERDILQGHRSDIDVRAQGTGTGGSGGFLVPEGFRATLTETLKAYGGLMNVATTITTSTGEDLPWPTNDDTGNEGEFIGENTAAPEQDFVFGQRKLGAYIVTSKLVKVPVPLLQDSAFDLETWLPRKLGERIGRRTARAWTVGTGVNEPAGIVEGVPVGKTGGDGQTTSITYEDLIDVEHSVDPAYRTRGRYVLHDQLLKVIRKLTDGDGRPLWTPVPAPGFPATINGFPYTIDNSMPEPGPSAKPLVFGDLEAAYVIRTVAGVATLRLAERFAEAWQVAFVAFVRVDGMVQDPAAARTYQHAAS